MDEPEIPAHRELTNSYHDWLLYLASPRAWTFAKLGYRGYSDMGPMTRGTLTHLAIAKFYQEMIDRGTPQNAKQFCTQVVYDEANRLAEIQATLSGRLDEALDKLDESVKVAIDLSERYCQVWAGDYQPVVVEGEFIHQGVVIHPDLVCMGKEGFGVVDFKTAARPDVAQLDGSMQLDLYAYVLQRTCHTDVAFITYHILQPDGVIIPVTRPPNSDYGDACFGEITGLQAINMDYALHETRPWNKQSSNYWTAEEIYMLDGLPAAERWMQANLEYRGSHDVRKPKVEGTVIGV